MEVDCVIAIITWRERTKIISCIKKTVART